MTRKLLTKTIARDNSIRTLCIDAEQDIWITATVPSPFTLMEFESAEEGDHISLVIDVVRKNMISPRIVDEPSDKEDEITIDELGPYFLAAAGAIMDAVDPSGEVRKRAEAFLAERDSADGDGSVPDIQHAAIVTAGS
jgi:hypothetical protein